MTGLDGWITLMTGSRFDPVHDQQAQKATTDLVGDDDHGVMYYSYDDKGTASESDDEIGYRIRVGGPDSGGSFSSVILIGMDADLDYDIDLFITVQDVENGVKLWYPGPGLNNSPNTTTTEPGGREFTLMGNYDFSQVTASNDPDWTGEDDIGTMNGLDHFVTIKLPFSEIKNQLAEDGIYITSESGVQYVLGTSTQTNAFNSDLGGVNGQVNSKLTFEELGAFSVVTAASNAFPVITSDGGDDTAYVAVTTGTTSVTTVTATDQDNDLLTYSISGGVDQSLFKIDPVSGALSFLKPPNYHNPTDSDGDNEYVVEVTASDGNGGTDLQEIFVTVTTSTDTTVPFITSFIPADEDLNAPKESDITFVFNEDIQWTGVAGNITLYQEQSGGWSGTPFETIPINDARVSIVGNMIIVDPNGTFNGGKWMTVTIDSGVIEDLAGNDFVDNNLTQQGNQVGADAPYDFKASTNDDNAPPSFVSSPQDNAVALAIDSNIQLIFDETILPESTIGNGDYFYIKKLDGTTVATLSANDLQQVTFSGNTVTLNPFDDLAYNTSYYVEIGSGAVMDTSGNVFTTGLFYSGTPYPVDFTTAEDTTAPSVLNVTSSNADTRPWIEGDTIFITVEFDETAYVTGTPQLTLETGTTDRTIDYTSGSGSTELTFTYVVQSGDTASDLDYLSASALSSDTIADASGNVLNYTNALPAPGSGVPGAGSLSVNKNLSIDLKPVNSLGATIATVNEDTTLTFTTISVSDADIGAGNLTVELTVVNGTLTAATGSGATITGDGTDSLTIVGTQTQVNDALNGLAYDPDLNFSGTDSLQIVTYDGATTPYGYEVHDSDTVTITVNPVDDGPPSAVDDFLTTDEDTEAWGNVSTNDSMPDGGTFSVASGPLHGTVTLSNSTGVYIYTPDENYYGTDSFTYTITDSDGDAATATGNITVNSINDAPVNAVPIGPVAIIHDVLTAISGVSVSDIEAENEGQDVTVTLSVTNGTLLINESVSGGLTSGQITNNGSASVVLTGTVAAINATLADATGLQYESAGAGYTGPDTLTAVTNDGGVSGSGGPLTDSDTVEIIVVDPVNTPPINTAPASVTLDEDVLTAITGISISDMDAGFSDITVTLSVLNGTLLVKEDVAGGLSGTDISGNGTATVVITGSQARINATLADLEGLQYQSDPNYNGSDTLTVLTDDQGNTGSGGVLTDSDNVAITVDPVNDAPVNTLPADPLTIAQDTATVITGVSISDVDAGNNDVFVTLTVTKGTLLVSDTVPLGLTATDISGNGTGSVVLTGTLAEINATLAASSGLQYRSDAAQSGLETLTVLTNDQGNTGSGGAKTDTDTLALMVRPKVTATATDAAASETGPDNGQFTIDLGSVNNTGGPVTVYYSVSGTASSSSDYTALSGSVAVPNGSRFATIDVTPVNDPNYEGDETVTVTLTSTSSSGFKVNNTPATVTIADNDPNAVDDTAAATEDGPSIITVDVTANDTDPDGDILTVTSIDTTGTLGSVTDNGDGTFTYDPNGRFESLGVGDTATDTFTYTVSDGNGGSATATVSVTITGRNDGPSVTDDTAAATEDGPSIITVDVTANDTDPDGDALTVSSIDTTGTLGSVTDNGDGTFTYDPNGRFESLGVGDTATDTFTYTVSDGNGGISSAEVTVTISGANDPPSLGPDSASTDEDTSVVLPVLANDSDPEGDSLALHSVNTSGTVGSVTINADGTITYDPKGKFDYLAPGEAATDMFTYTVRDEHGLMSTVSVIITVEGQEDPAVISKSWIDELDDLEGEGHSPFQPSSSDQIDLGDSGYSSPAVYDLSDKDDSRPSSDQSGSGQSEFGYLKEGSSVLFDKVPDLSDLELLWGASSDEEDRGVVNDVTGLYGYEKGIAEGRVLVFNMDEMKVVDLATQWMQSGRQDAPTGLPGYYDAVKQGKILVFNLNEINLADFL